MDLLIAANSVPLANADGPPVSGTPQYATDGNPATQTPPTTYPAYIFNALLREIVGLIQAAGLTPDRNDFTQMLQAINALITISIDPIVNQIGYLVNNSTDGDFFNIETQTQLYHGVNTMIADNVIPIVNQIGYLVNNSGDGESFVVGTQAQLSDAVQYLARYYARRFGSANYTVLNATGAINANALGMLPVDATTGSLNLTLPPANSFSAGSATCRLSLFRIDGTGNTVTLACNGSDTFNYTGALGSPLVTTDLLPGERLDLWSDGVGGWFALRKCRGRVQRFVGIAGSGSADQTAFSWTPPVGVYGYTGRILGGGGSGGAGANTTGGGAGGGAAGGCIRELGCWPGVPVTGSIGYGGLGVSSGTGVAGGTTEIDGTSMYATGGLGGGGGTLAPSNNGGTGGNGYGGDFNLPGAAGGDGSLDGTAATGIGGTPPLGFGTPGRAAQNGSGAEAVSINAGTWGAGGGGTYGPAGGTSGNGGPGLVEIAPL